MNSATSAVMLVLLAAAIGPPIGLVLGVLFGLVSTAATKLSRLWNDHELGPKRRGGREVDAGSAPQLVAILNELSRRAAIPTPRLYVIEDPRANAVAIGRDRRHASICITTGLLQGLARDELTGVLCHELAHVSQRTALTRTAASTLAAAISLLALFGPFFGLGIGLSLLLLVIALLAAILGQLAISRAGEYAADERGARLSGRPEALVAALRLMSTDDAEFEDVANSKMVIAMLVLGKWLVGPRRDNPFSGHPLPTNRIAALEQLAREMDLDDHVGRV
jgi:heat shock protein HtpX